MARYSYSCVGYGVFSLLGEIYRMGRIEMFDNQEESGYAVHEGFFCLPFEASAKFENLIDSLQTDFPMHFELGSMKWCSRAVSEHLGIPVDKLNDMDTKKAFYREKYIKDYGYTPEEGAKKLEEKLKNNSGTKNNT